MRSNVKKIKIWALCIFLLFAVTTAIGLLVLPMKSYAENSSPTTLKFRQVAAGEDFAVGLTYDGDLYGWSLLDKSVSGNGGNNYGLADADDRNVDTLGKYYPSVPIRIDVKFTYATYRSTGVTAAGLVETPNGTCMGKTADDRTIAQISATRTTAAFITKSGLLYVWGKDSSEPTAQSASDKNLNLLLRTAPVEDRYEAPHAFVPGMVDYTVSDLFRIFPAYNDAANRNENFAVSIDSIVSSEYNYLVRYNSSSEECNFMWGQTVYDQLNSSNGPHSFGGGHIASNIYSGGWAYLGDGNIYTVSASSFNVRGKNYSVASTAAVSGSDELPVANTLLAVDPDKTVDGYTFYGKDDSDKKDVKIVGAVTKGWQAIGGVSASVGVQSNATFYGSDGKPASGVNAPLSKFSAGNGYGYMIDNNGKLLFWGDNSLGQMNGVKGAAHVALTDISASVAAAGANFVQVVAGKVLTGYPVLESFGSSDEYAAPNYDKWAQDTDENLTGKLVNGYSDGETFLSAVLEADGKVTVIGAVNGAPFKKSANTDCLDAHGVSVDSTTVKSANKIVALSGGYDNCLFAISSLGKIYKITATSGGDLNCYRYDEFSDFATEDNPTDNEHHNIISNWNVNNTVSMQFTSGYSEDAKAGKPSSVVVGLYDAFDENKKSDQSYPSHIKDLVPATSVNDASSFSGDAYRIVMPKIPTGAETSFTVNSYTFDNVDSVYKKDTAPFVSADSSLSSGNEIEFYWSDDTQYRHKLDAGIALRYFDLEFRYKRAYTDGDGKKHASVIDFVITPKRATQGKAIIIKYNVGRYDSVSNFDKVDGGTPYFYDTKLVNVRVGVDNSDLTANFVTSKNVASDGDPAVMMSRIPVLDPNNSVNNTYSLAVMDVSTGLEQIRDIAKSKVSGYSLTDEALYDLIASGDTGFPRSDKVEKGNLLYFNKYAGAYYNDRYEFLAYDHDGDIVTVDRISNVSGINSVQGSTEYFSYNIVEKTVVFELGLNAAGDAAIIGQLKELFTETDNNMHVPEFDNQYGLRISVADNGDITVKYDVLTISATKSMPGDYVGYTENDVSSPVTKLATSNSYIGVANLIRPRLNDNHEGENKTLENDNKDNIHRGLEVFTQSSLTFSNIKGVYGAPTSALSGGDSNTYDYAAINLRLEVPSPAPIDLSGYFNDVSNIEIAFRGEVGDEARKKLIQSFGGKAEDDEGASDEDIAKESLQITKADKMSFSYFVRRTIDKDHPYEFSVQLRRVQPEGKNKTFEYNTDSTAETITIYFKVTATFTPTQSFHVLSTPASVGTVNGSGKVQLKSRLEISDTLLAKCEIEAYSSDTNILTVAPSTDKKELVITSLTNGTAFVRYKVKLFGENEYVIEDSFPVTVVMLLSMKDTVMVSDTVQVSISDLTGALSHDNTELGAVEFSLENYENGKPFYYQIGARKDGSKDLSPDDNDYNWTNTENISFLNDVYMDSSASKAYIGLEMGIFDPGSVDNMPVYRIVVRFADAAKKEYLVAFRVLPAAQTLRDVNGREFELEVNKGAGTISISSRDNGIDEAKTYGLIATDDGSFEVPISFIKTLMFGYDPSTDYTIHAVQAKSYNTHEDYSEYVEVKTMRENANEFYITPMYPTDGLTGGKCNIRVSVKSSNSDSSNTTILNFSVKVTGIKTVLTKGEYRTIILAAFFGVLGLLVIVFFIRMGIYWKKKADQRRIIKKNQTLIKMRDKMHNKTEAVSKEKLVRTKLKMEDPKYAKMFDEMRKQREAQTGISLENSIVADKAEKKVKAEKAKKKRGKKSLEELQAELAAKREAVARMQMGDFSAVPDGMAAESVPPVDAEMPEGVPVFDPAAGFEGVSAESLDAQFKAAMEQDGIVFEAVEDDGNQG